MSKVSLRSTNRSLNSVSSAQSSPANSLRRAGGVASFVKTRGGISGGETAVSTNSNAGYNSPTPSEKRSMPPPPKMKALYNGQKNYEDMKVPIPETYEEEWDTGKSEDGAMKQPGRYQSDGFPERLAREWGNGNGNHGTTFPDETFPGLSDTESSLYRLNPKSAERNTQYNFDDYSSEADQQTQLDYEPSDVQYIDSEVGTKLPYHQSSPPRVPLMPEPPYAREEDYNSDSSVDVNDVDEKVQNTQKRLSMERQQLQRAAATSVPAVNVAKAVTLQRGYSNRSAKGKQPEVAIRERSPDNHRDSITPLSPDRRSFASAGLHRKRSYSALKDVDFSQFTTQEWHQTTDEPGRRTKAQTQSRYRSVNDVYGQPPSNMRPETHKENQITYFSSLPREQYYDESANLMKQLQDILQETKDAREAFINGTRQLEREIEERSRQVKKRRVELGSYLGGVKERLGRITGA